MFFSQARRLCKRYSSYKMKTENIIQKLEAILTEGNVQNACNSSFYKWTIGLSDNEREVVYRHF